MEFYENYKLLAEQILQLSITDFRNTKQKADISEEQQRRRNYISAKLFFMSDLFKTICEEFRIDIGSIFAELEKQKNSKDRNKEKLICVNER